jgi:putative salt-induced outer membrane protein YdiY
MTSVRRSVLLVAIVVLTSASAAQAQRRTDAITFVNGDQLTGEVKKLWRGQLEVRTDNLGTVYIKWEKVTGLVAARRFDVRTEDGRDFLGAFALSSAGTVTIVLDQGTVILPVNEVISIAPIGSSFWRRLDGSLDAGFTYTRSSGVGQFNVALNTTFHRPSFTVQLQANSIITRTEGEDTGSRSSAALSYVRTLHERWLAIGSVQLERNASLGLALRSVLSGGLGYRFIDSNRAQFFASGGLSGNEEQGVDLAAVTNLEGVLSTTFSFYTYDFPKTSFDIKGSYYPSLSDPGRNRLQFDTSVSRELFRDFSLSASFYDSYDSRPPSSATVTNDFGIVTSLGWKF